MKILVAIDLSESTKKIIDNVSGIAKALTAKVWLLHVADPDPEFIGYDVGPQTVRDAVAKKFGREHTELQAIADSLRREGLDVTALLIQGVTVETISKEAAKLEADIVAIGSHGRGAMHQLLIGSVSEGVLRHAVCPVLVIPTHERG